MIKQTSTTRRCTWPCDIFWKVFIASHVEWTPAFTFVSHLMSYINLIFFYNLIHFPNWTGLFSTKFTNIVESSIYNFLWRRACSCILLKRRSSSRAVSARATRFAERTRAMKNFKIWSSDPTNLVVASISATFVYTARARQLLWVDKFNAKIIWAYNLWSFSCDVCRRRVDELVIFQCLSASYESYTVRV